MNNAKFRADLKRITEKAKNKTNLFVRKLVLDLDRRIILKSPVGNPSAWKSPAPEGYIGGTFKANWNIGFSTPDTSVSDAVDPSPYDTVSNSSASILRANAKLESFVAGTIVYITNSLPYAYRLEYESWSDQAPAGMVRTTLAELNSAIQAVGAEVRLV
jgi:hypothetical protein